MTTKHLIPVALVVLLGVFGCNTEKKPATSPPATTEGTHDDHDHEDGDHDHEDGDHDHEGGDHDHEDGDHDHEGGDHEGHDHGGSDDNAGQTDMEKMTASLASFSEEDRASAMKQHMCPVTGEMLGTMGVPEKIEVKGKTVWICCDGCKEKIQADPDKYLAKLEK